MISAAKNIRDNTEPLVKVPVKHLFDALRNPRHNIAALLNQIRVARTLDPSRYPALKTQLPYFVCGIFNPPYRRTDNFAYTEYFIIDIDHIADKGLILNDLRERIIADSRTLLCFVSPSGDGLKIIMRLAEKCYDSGLYKNFYQIFITKFAAQYDIRQVVDSKTCDVTRACFMSSDPEAYYNPEAESVVIADYINPEYDLRKTIEAKHNAVQTADTTSNKQTQTKERNEGEPPDDIIAAIKQRLNVGRIATPQKQPVHVPDELNKIIDDLRIYIESFNIVVAEIINIQYGKKIRVNIATKKAEINLFFGKKGYTVIQSPRSGTDSQANDLTASIIKQYLYEHDLY